jgi:hypothetical protein
MFKVPERFRVTHGTLGTDKSRGNTGYFLIKSLKLKKPLRAIVSDELGWEHVSVSLPARCPTWDEMCFVKDLFWDATDLVIQLHPPRSEYVNTHEYCLHMWRKSGTNDFLEMPPKIMVGI